MLGTYLVSNKPLIVLCFCVITLFGITEAPDEFPKNIKAWIQIANLEKSIWQSNKANFWLCVSYTQCKEHQCHWACLRIKMRKLSVIRCSSNKWKQCLRDHLLPTQFSFICRYKHVMSISWFLFSFLSCFSFKKKHRSTKKSTTPNVTGDRKQLYPRRYCEKDESSVRGKRRATAGLLQRFLGRPKLRTESTRFQGPLAGFCIPTLPEADSVGA